MSSTPSPQAWQRYSFRCCCCCPGAAANGAVPSSAASADCARPLRPEPPSGPCCRARLLLGSCVLLDSSGTGPWIRHKSGAETRAPAGADEPPLLTSCCSCPWRGSADAAVDVAAPPPLDEELYAASSCSCGRAAASWQPVTCSEMSEAVPMTLVPQPGHRQCLRSAVIVA